MYLLSRPSTGGKICLILTICAKHVGTSPKLLLLNMTLQYTNWAPRCCMRIFRDELPHQTLHFQTMNLKAIRQQYINQSLSVTCKRPSQTTTTSKPSTSHGRHDLFLCLLQHFDNLHKARAKIRICIPTPWHDIYNLWRGIGRNLGSDTSIHHCKSCLDCGHIGEWK